MQAESWELQLLEWEVGETWQLMIWAYVQMVEWFKTLGDTHHLFMSDDTDQIIGNVSYLNLTNGWGNKADYTW